MEPQKYIARGSRLIAFVSGPLKADASYFNTHYLARIRDGINTGHHFIVGPARGIDTMTFDYLRRSGVAPSRVSVYLSTSQVALMKGRFKCFNGEGGHMVVVGGGYTERDEAMTRASHYDILRYRTEEQSRAFYGAAYWRRVSGTEKNEIRRRLDSLYQFKSPFDGAFKSSFEFDYFKREPV